VRVIEGVAAAIPGISEVLGTGCYERALVLPLGRRAGAQLGRALDGPTATAYLPPGSLLLLYTDGLFEWPGATLNDGFARLRSAAADCADLPVESICTELLSRMTPPGGYRDDVRRAGGAPQPFGAVQLRHRPTGRAGPDSRRARPAARVAEENRRLAPQELDILLATGEAVTNAIEHGSHSEPDKTVSVEASVRRQTVSITVSDTGRWVDTVRTLAGTQVNLEFHDAFAVNTAGVRPG
jgi:histidine kinase-like protein/stage II sporulation SpoE-like protein